MEPIVSETLHSSYEYITKLIAAHEKMATFFQGNEEGRGLETFKLYIEGVDWLQQALDGIKKVDQAIVQNINVEDINPKLVEVEEALHQRDYILLADLLEYEVSPILEEWLSDVREAIS